MAGYLTTHVLDTQRGKPAAGMGVTLYRQTAGDWQQIAQGVTNQAGRITDWLSGEHRQQGVYRITFDTDAYYSALGERCFFPVVSFDFRLDHENEHYHVPLLISAFGLSTYRGS